MANTRGRLVFGAHYSVELHREQAGRGTFVLGATRHGFRADASEVGGELETHLRGAPSTLGYR